MVFPAATWEDYLALSFDEIRQFGAGSIQVTRRLRAALIGLSGEVAGQDRKAAVLRYLHHLDEAVRRSGFDAADLAQALRQDRQGLGLSRPGQGASDAERARMGWPTAAEKGCSPPVPGSRPDAASDRGA